MIQVVEHLESRVARLIEEVEALRVVKNQLETENDGLKITVADYDKMKGELEEARQQSAAAEAARKEFDGLAAKFDEVETGRQIAQLERDELQAKLDEALGRFEEMQEAINEAFAQRDEFAAELAAGKTRIAELEGEREGVARHREEANGQLTEARAEIEELWAEVQALTEERDAMRAQVTTSGEIARERDEWRARYEEEQALRETAQVNAERAATLEKELDSLHGQKQSLEERLREAERRDGLMRDRLSRLIERIESAESFLSQVELIHENA